MLPTLVKKSLFHNLRVTFWLLATLSLCAALVVMFTTITVDTKAKMRDTLRRLGANAMAHALTAPGAGDPSAPIQSTPDWEAARRIAFEAGADMIVLTVRPATLKGEPVTVIGADPGGLARMTPYWFVSGGRDIPPGNVLIGRMVADRFGFDVGSSFELQWSDSGDRREFTVSGVFESGDADEGRIFTGAGFRPGVLGPGRAVEGGAASPPESRTYALLSVPDGEGGIERLAGRLESGQFGVRLEPLRQITYGEESILAKISLLMALALLAVLVLSALGVTATTVSRVVQRRKELALLQALGAARRSVAAFLLLEGATIGGAASVTGFFIGTLFARQISLQVFDVTVTPRLTAFAAGLAATTAVALFAGLAAVRKASGIEPHVALRGD